MPTVIPALVLCCSKAGFAIVRSLGDPGIPVAGLLLRALPARRCLPPPALRYRCPDPNKDERAFIEFRSRSARNGRVVSFSRWGMARRGLPL